MPPSTMNNSNSGQTLRKRRYCSSVQKPMTCSMPARLYQLRSKITISPAVGRCDIALQIQLSFLAIGPPRQRPHGEHRWAHPLRDGFDRPALAGGVTPFEDDDDAEAVVPHPILQRTELDLQFAQFRFIFLSLHRLAPGCARRSGAVSRHW